MENGLLDMPEEMVERYLNEGFSGGEKGNEILQLLMIEPKLAILDEIDSGLDIDALQVVSKGINAMRGNRIWLHHHYSLSKIIKLVTPDYVHIVMDGHIVKSEMLLY